MCQTRGNKEQNGTGLCTRYSESSNSSSYDVLCLVASSVYDSKPVHYLSMMLITIEWIEVKKKVYNVDPMHTNQING